MALNIDLSAHNQSGSNVDVSQCYVRFAKNPLRVDYGVGKVLLGFEFFVSEAAKNAGKNSLGGIQIEEGAVEVDFVNTATVNDIITAAYAKVLADAVTWPEFAGAVDA